MNASIVKIVVHGVVTDIRKPVKVTHTDNSFTVASLRLRDETGQIKVLFFNDRAADVFNVHVGQTVTAKASVRESKTTSAPLELVIEPSAPVLVSPHPLSINIRKPFGSPVLTQLRDLEAGTSVAILARIVGLARAEDGQTLSVADTSGLAQLRVAGDDYPFRLSQNVLFESLAVVAQGKSKSPALRFNHTSSVIVEPDMEEAERLSLWFVANPRGPVVGGLFNVAPPPPPPPRMLFLRDVGAALANRSSLQGTATACVTRLALHAHAGGETSATVALTDATGTLARVALPARVAAELLACAPTDCAGEAEQRLVWMRVAVALRVERGALAVQQVRPVAWSAELAALDTALRAR